MVAFSEYHEKIHSEETQLLNTTWKHIIAYGKEKTKKKYGSYYERTKDIGTQAIQRVFRYSYISIHLIVVIIIFIFIMKTFIIGSP
jgi:hypothetical protein